MDLTTRVYDDEFEAVLEELLEVLARLLDMSRDQGPTFWVPELERDLLLLRRHDGAD